MMNFTRNAFFVGILAGFSLQVNAQDNYNYSVDLNNVINDELTVELLAPSIKKTAITFYLPKIVPGTYMNSNYGKYVHELQAFDKNGKSLSAKRSGDNSWDIKNADKLYKLVYKVEDTWDSEIDNKVYPMCGTNFEAGKNFVLNTCGIFGYFDGMKKSTFNLSFKKPLNFYAATGLIPISSTTSTDVFRCANADELYDSPIMFSLPDTASVRVGNADVLVAVYSPNKKTSAKFLASHLEKLMMATKDYLGGKLPVDKYAFIYYFNGEQKKMETTGAWEHSYSSFYSLDEQPQEEAINHWVDISAHEFFHIVTPLTISSKEVKEFNFNETVLSKHVWLYEGSTEYYSHHAQVWAGLITPEKFLATLAQKINYSRLYFNDSLSFTELSTESAGKWAAQYGNVYMKGALISTCLDLYLLKLSGGQYGFKDLKHDLGVKYGADKYFMDEELFDEIVKLSYPEIKEFMLAHVVAGKPIPYEKYFAMAGVNYIVKEGKKNISLAFDDNATAAQLKLRNVWLNGHKAKRTVDAAKKDVETIDGIIKALYDVISGPAGERDWNRFRSLFHADAYMGAITPKNEFRKFSPEEYIQRNGPFFKTNSFMEKELGRTVNEFGNIAQVFTSYEYTAGTPAKTQRGINSVELVNEKGRWWILSVGWDEESATQPIPPKYLSEKK